MFSGKITTTCSIGVVAAGRTAAGLGEDALDSEMPISAAPTTSTPAPAAKDFLPLRNVIRRTWSPFDFVGGPLRRATRPAQPFRERVMHPASDGGKACQEAVTESFLFCDCPFC